MSGACGPRLDVSESAASLRDQSIPSLRHVVLVEQAEVRVELWTLGANGWVCAALGPDEVVALGAIGIEVPVAELYEGFERFPS